MPLNGYRQGTGKAELMTYENYIEAEEQTTTLHSVEDLFFTAVDASTGHRIKFEFYHMSGTLELGIKYGHREDIHPSGLYRVHVPLPPQISLKADSLFSKDPSGSVLRISQAVEEN